MGNKEPILEPFSKRKQGIVIAAIFLRQFQFRNLKSS